MVFSITGTSRLPSNTPLYALPTFTSPDIYVGLSESSVAYINFFFSFFLLLVYNLLSSFQTFTVHVLSFLDPCRFPPLQNSPYCWFSGVSKGLKINTFSRNQSVLKLHYFCLCYLLHCFLLILLLFCVWLFFSFFPPM